MIVAINKHGTVISKGTSVKEVESAIEYEKMSEKKKANVWLTHERYLNIDKETR